MERKFYVAPHRAMLAYGVLRHLCRPDGAFPAGQINSLYFDTIDLDQHRKSDSGEYDKDKVRIRWYGEEKSLAGNRAIFLELKSKRGFAGTKERRRLEVPASCLTLPHLADGIVPKSLLHDTLASFGYFPADSLWPVIKISYWRYRFTEPLTGQRVSLDSRIRSTMVRPMIGNGEKELELPGAVIEIKGSSMELPVTLKKLGMLDVDWTRFSKYSACIGAHEEALGSIGRLSPSGRIV
jgi:hypothetical protein